MAAVREKGNGGEKTHWTVRREQRAMRYAAKCQSLVKPGWSVRRRGLREGVRRRGHSVAEVTPTTKQKTAVSGSQIDDRLHCVACDVAG